MAADPARRQWWAPTGVPALQLSLLLDGMDSDPPGVTVKKGRKRVQVHQTRLAARFPLNDPAAIPTLAQSHLRDLLDHVREHLGLAPLPPLPTPPAADLPPELFRPDPPDTGLPPDLERRLLNGEIIDPKEIVAQIHAHYGQQ
ncbi:hypothetical protein AB0J83_09760 [Actinoplanes sp. NPDC049596]|uniref:hypothetical protein n=1 Tax=unclassified Actinoplanes TaxID=2626549 RepID=UPI00342DEFA4